MKTDMKRIITLLIVPLLLPTEALHAAEFFVSPAGNDGDSGTKVKPFATIERARDAARGAKDGATIWLAAGNYPVAKTIQFSAADSGSATATLVIRAKEGAVIDAGRYLAVGDFEEATSDRLPEVARGHVFEFDLKKAGLPPLKKWPDFFSGGGNVFDVYEGTNRLRLARWPNDGETVMKRVVDRGDEKKGPGTRGGTFEFHENHIKNWKRTADEGRLWLIGSWYAPWRFEAIRAGSLDATNKTITFATGVDSGIGSKYVSDGAGAGNEPWHAINLLEELDQPGEWVADFDSQKIYLWPQSPTSAICVAFLANPVISIKGATNIVLRGLTIRHGLGNGIEIRDGANCAIVACDIADIGNDAIVVAGGTNHRVSSCDLHRLGGGGIVMGGGDRKKLVPAGHLVENNHIWDFARTRKTYAPGIALGAYGAAQAVGCTLAHNRIHDAPHAGILFGGNENVIELNEIYDVVKDSEDMGAIYTYHDWTSYDVVRNNFVHHAHRATGYYADDADSGDLVEGNIFYRVATGPFSGGGHDNIFRGNISIASVNGSHIDSRGIPRGYATDASLFRQFDAVDVHSPPWSARYPTLGSLTNDHPESPRGDVIESNVVVACERVVHFGGKSNEFARCRITNNVVIAFDEMKFTDAANLDFSLAPDSPVFKKLPGFAPIPFHSIGLVTNEFRREIPAREPAFCRAVTPEPRDTNSLAASILVESPGYLQVIQRDKSGIGHAKFSGAVGPGVDEVRYRIVGQPLKSDFDGKWMSIRADRVTRTFTTPLELPSGGWYRLEAFAFNDGVRVAQWFVDRFGVGEIFIVAGQSNAGNHGSEKTSTKTKLVTCFDGKQWHLAEDPMRGASGNGGSFMPSFGDALAAKIEVPIGIIPIAVGATSVREWLPTGTRMTNQPTTGANVKKVGDHEWEATGKLFDTLADRLAKLGPNGCRAILWHQGESDAGQARGGYPADRQISGAQYAAFMEQLIRASREKAGWQIPWLTALVSYHSEKDASDDEFRAAEKSLWEKHLALPGPDTDALRAEYRAGVHFNTSGLKKHGELWAEKIGVAFPDIFSPAFAPK
jgi:hypothetical protein